MIFLGIKTSGTDRDEPNWPPATSSYVSTVVLQWSLVWLCTRDEQRATLEREDRSVFSLKFLCTSLFFWTHSERHRLRLLFASDRNSAEISDLYVDLVDVFSRPIKTTPLTPEEVSFIPIKHLKSANMTSWWRHHRLLCLPCWIFKLKRGKILILTLPSLREKFFKKNGRNYLEVMSYVTRNFAENWALYRAFRWTPTRKYSDSWWCCSRNPDRKNRDFTLRWNWHRFVHLQHRFIRYDFSLFSFSLNFLNSATIISTVINLIILFFRKKWHQARCRKIDDVDYRKNSRKFVEKWRRNDCSEIKKECHRDMWISSQKYTDRIKSVQITRWGEGRFYNRELRTYFWSKPLLIFCTKNFTSVFFAKISEQIKIDQNIVNLTLKNKKIELIVIRL